MSYRKSKFSEQSSMESKKLHSRIDVAEHDQNATTDDVMIQVRNAGAEAEVDTVRLQAVKYCSRTDSRVSSRSILFL